MNPVEADTARLDAMAGNALLKGIGRIAQQVIASQVAPSRAFERLQARLLRGDGTEDSKRDVDRSYLRPLGWIGRCELLGFDGFRFS